MPRMGNPSILKIMFAHIALLGFQRAGGFVRRFSSRPLLYTAFRPLQAEPAIFFHGKATPDVLKQKFDVSESTHSVPISQETP